MRVEVVADLAVLARVDAGLRRAARRSRSCWCRRSGRAAARCRWRGRHTASVPPSAPAARRRRWPLMTMSSPRRPTRSRPRTTAGCRGTSPSCTWAATARRRRRGTGRTPSTCRAGAPGARSPRRAANDRYIEIADLAHGDDHHRGPREVAVDPEREEPAEHEELVGERVEERAGARGAVASREPAVEPVGGGEHEPQRHGEPATSPGR